MGKKYMIRCDMEGVSGIVSYEQAEPGRSEYKIGQRFFMRDLNALLSGLKAGGTDEIHIYDEHCAGRNILLDELAETDGVTVYAGKPPYTADWAGGLDESFDGMILLGYHSMRGSAGCLLQHTYEPDIKALYIDGVRCGEIGMETRIAADYGVPLVLITADSEGVHEALELAPQAIGVAVKESISEYGGACYAAAVTERKIFAAAKTVATQSCPRVKARKDESARLQVEFFDTPFAALYERVFGKAEFKKGSLSAQWAQYRANKQRIDEILEVK